MKLKPTLTVFFKRIYCTKFVKIMRNTIVLLLFNVFHILAVDSYSQTTALTVNFEDFTVRDILTQIEDQSEFYFLYNSKLIDVNRKTSLKVEDQKIDKILSLLFEDTGVNYMVYNQQIVLAPARFSNSLTPDLPLFGTFLETAQQQLTGRVTDSQTGETIPGVSVIIRGTTTGTITDADGIYSLSNVPDDAVLVFSYVGMITRQVLVEGRDEINVTLEPDMIGIEEVVAIGYGTMRRSDLTGSVVRADIETFRDSPNTSIIQSLHGSVPGLSVGQVNQAGQEPGMLIRGQSSLSGELSPLIVVDGVIFRGNMIDINPNDIESIDILKDASSAAIYGSQASNGVILITTTKSGGIDGKPTVNYTSSYSFQNPVKELRPPTPDGFYKQKEETNIYSSRIAESGYLEKNPNWLITNTFTSSEEVLAYHDGRTSDWYSELTNDNMFTQNHNLSLSNSTRYNNYLISIGFFDQAGYMLNDDYNRINARINIDNTITDWLIVGVQSFFTTSDYSGQEINPNYRFISPYSTIHDQHGNLAQIVSGSVINPFIQAKANYLDKRRNFFGNIYADIDIPFIEGLSYRLNFSNNYRTTSEYYFREYASTFQGQGSKTEGNGYDWSTDNIISYNRIFNDIHNINLSLVYGLEKRSYNSTRALGSIYDTSILGYNRLQLANSDRQEAISSAWEESSLYSMMRIFYGFDNKYLLTGTIRRDGFSGFSEENKFGLFPSISTAWVVSEESFLNESPWLDYLKVRLSYGSVGNRTIGRYQTLARVAGGFDYMTITGSPVFVQGITSMASPNLKWETTTGINAGFDFGFARIIHGSIDYYNNNTTNLLYEVDIPAISRFEKFPDNLGRLHNQGLEMNITSINIRRSDLEWNSTFKFSRNRNTLKELLGFDLTGDGKEDDLISEGLFIGESIDAIYDFKIDGKWQVGDNIPAGFDLGQYRTVDLNGDGEITPDDKTIIGYRSPAYGFSIQNSIRYRDWTLMIFINSLQGGKNHYFAEDTHSSFSTINSSSYYRFILPDGIDYWTPENPDARYQRPDIQIVESLQGRLFAQRSFVRLQDLSLSYNVPPNLIDRYGINNLRVYFHGKNLLTLTKWNGWDPETGQTIDRGGRPVIKSYTIGLNVEF